MDIACRVYSIMEHPVLITTQQIKTMVIQLVDHEKTHKKLKSGQLIVITEIQNCHFCDTSSKQDYFRQHTSWETNKKSCNQYTHLYNLFLLKLHLSVAVRWQNREELFKVKPHVPTQATRQATYFMKRQFIITHTIRQTQTPTLLDKKCNEVLDYLDW